ncbi:MAG: hypothetical protein JW987_09110, partial [Anaerolineaceae bacterium]|nr:hypothetical protein [Anaerolineaceae bacterium]
EFDMLFFHPSILPILAGLSNYEAYFVSDVIMLVSYLNAIEKVLLAKSDVASKAGHPNLRGGPREWFVEEFLLNHLPSLWELGQGEIISSDSAPNPSTNMYRNQNDLVIYRRDYPKISYSPKDKAYLIEGVVATLEIKSKLNSTEFSETNEASQRHKNLISEGRSGLGLQCGDNIWVPSRHISYVIAYDGPKEMSTIANWLPTQTKELGVAPDLLVDMVVVLGKGVVWRIDAFPAYEIPDRPENHNWAYIQQQENNIYALFAHMLTIRRSDSSSPRTINYVNKLPKNGIKTT